jgi:hypothetical protein
MLSMSACTAGKDIVTAERDVLKLQSTTETLQQQLKDVVAKNESQEAQLELHSMNLEACKYAVNYLNGMIIQISEMIMTFHSDDVEDVPVYE